MSKEFLTPITFTVGFVLALFMIIAVFAAKLDTNSQTYCNDVIHEFVDNARASGYISQEGYMQMMNKINSTNNLYTVHIMHKSKVISPKTDMSGNIIEGEFIEGYNTYYEDEILKMFDTGVSVYENYPLKTGDYLKVTYSLKEPTLSAKIMMSMFATKSKYNTVQGSYGGYVGSTEDTLISH